ncbi:MAG: small multi-drug export protein [Floccifex porci]|uniref:COG2426 family protein n=1 Tax=Floccifex porci TaxID=2606629 RepID=UPI002A8082ED|nr:small multi-drug export protein [Floccifex porci]MDY4796637.1 small multi-drug export protein [Floccifex porci]
MLKKYIIVFLISMVPIVELRGAIPIGVGAYNLPVLTTFIICIIGNMIPVPFIFLFARKVLEWGQGKPYIGPLFKWFIKKGHKGGQKLQSKAGRGLYYALFLFVGIPIPGTGAWTGTLAASILDLDFKKTVFSVLGGVLLAGIIMAVSSYGLFEIIF